MVGRGWGRGGVKQVCRCAGQPTSGLVEECMHNRSASGGAGGGIPLGNALCLLMVVVVSVMSVAGFAHLKRTQKQMRDQMDQVCVSARTCACARVSVPCVFVAPLYLLFVFVFGGVCMYVCVHSIRFREKIDCTMLHPPSLGCRCWGRVGGRERKIG